MAPNPKVARAFKAMRDLGIKEETVKPILKNLLKLYDKKWELIEEENYRALADAIFEQEEVQATEHRKQHKNPQQEEMIEEAHVHEEPERPLKRLRLRYQDDHVSSGTSTSKLGGTSSSRQPKVEEAELPAVDNVLAGSQTVSPQPLVRNKGKQPVLPMPLSVQERFEPPQPDAADKTHASPTRRAGSDSVSGASSLKEKGKEPASPQIAPREKKSISEKVSHTGRLKVPKAEPGVVLLPEKQLHSSRALIKPKDEPLTDDMPQFEVPIAVIHPEPLSKDNQSIGNGSIREANGTELLVPQSVDGKDSTDGVLASSSERRTNCELATIVAESSSNIEIASSPFGEVKISLSCNYARGRPDFHMPSIDDVLKTVEDKCLRSYKVLDPSFSVMKLMKDVCECVLELGTDSVNKSQETIGVTAAVDLLKQSNTVIALAAKGNPFGSSNGSVTIQHVAEAAQSHIPRLPHSSNGMHDCTQTDKNNTENSCEIGEVKEPNDLELADSRSLVAVQQRQVMLGNGRSVDDVVDIAKGQERVVISLINEVNGDCPPSFHYIPQNAVFQNAYVNFSLARIGENCCSICSGDCLLSSTPCACANESGGEFVYTIEGLIKEDFLEECISMNRDPEKHCHFYCKQCPLERSKNDGIPEPCKGHLMRRFIKECWWKCGCSNQCGNRVVQRGINCNLQVFMTPEGKGWGLRTLQDLPKGAFVCEYVGEVLTNAELYERVSRSPSSEEHAYPVLLDADWGAEEVLKDEEALCLDATHYGNVARFINHKCFDSNLVEIPVEVETPDHHYYHLAFFTTRKVNALEELTWDYGIDFDDHDHPVKAFKCRCGSKFCRNIKRSRSRSRCRR